MVRFDHAKTDVEKKAAFNNMLAIADAHKAKILEGDSFRFWESWKNPVIRELAPSMPGAKPLALAHACRPEITAAEVSDVLNFLVKGGFLEKNDEGNYVQTNKSLTTGRMEVTPLAVRTMHRQMGELALEAIEGVAQDKVEAIKWFRKAAELGSVEAQYALGYLYQEGLGVVKDYTEAVKWFRKAAEQGNMKAQLGLGSCYKLGAGVEKNDEEAVKWYRSAADQGNAQAQHNLGIHYLEGLGIGQDKVEAAKWFRKAAEQGGAESQGSLGLCYYMGIGVDQDYSEAVKWFRKAAEQGNTQAQYNLGFCYIKGYGVTQDKTEGLKWLRKAADQGDEDASNAIKAFYID